VKAACPVWSGGKGGDNFKTLPIAIPGFLFFSILTTGSEKRA